MAPTDSTEGPGHLEPAQRAVLIDVARRSIEHGLATGRPMQVAPAEYDVELRAIRASFVTLNAQGRLRGCIGRLEAARPLVVDVAENAFAAAFRDSRFPPLSADEWPEVDLHLSLLTAPEPMHFSDEADLIRQIRPGEDGLILQDGPYRGTFLPSVWESLPDPVEFLMHLKHKAGLAANHWSDTVEVSRYRTESFGEGDLA
ncbi:MAG: AmmeMemoRadiSam system protein A [Sedimenticolaceae bacterium]